MIGLQIVFNVQNYQLAATRGQMNSGRPFCIDTNSRSDAAADESCTYVLALPLRRESVCGCSCCITVGRMTGNGSPAIAASDDTEYCGLRWLATTRAASIMGSPVVFTIVDASVKRAIAQR
jgi:hypothetical protein